MGRNPKRASGVKALQAIRENGQASRAKKHQGSSENTQPGVKRSSSPTSLPNPKRTALGNVTNNPQPHQPFKPVKAATITANSTQLQSLAEERTHHSDTAVHQRLPDLNESVEASQTSTVSGASEDTPVTAVQHFLQATSLSDDSLRSEESLTEDIELPTPPPSSTVPSSVESGQLWKDIDQAEANDPLFSAEYTPEIFHYMRKREEYFSIEPYMSRQPDITAAMRTILVDWLVEVQENFELFHETLYIAVKLTDLYLNRREVKREYLQLVGATCMLIASKFEELSPPLVDDFLYLCDDAYTHQELLRMERDILHALNYDINVPVSYRFVRRLARAAEATMETHTLARYIAESTLQDYQFVDVKPSLVAASAMFLALRMRKLGAWTPTLQHYSSYSVQEMLPVVQRLNALIQTPSSGTTTTVRSKYSHEVFFKVALTPALEDVTEDARQALLECPTLRV